MTDLLTVGEADLLPKLFSEVVIPEAVREGVAVIGLVGVVLLARTRGFIPAARGLLLRLEREAGIYLSPDVRDAALASVGE